MNKFENVDVLASLQQIMQQNTAAFQSDFDIDKKILTRAAKSKNAEDRVYLWFSRPNGTHCLRERDVFLRGTREHNTFRFYHEQTKERVLAYAVVLSGMESGKVKGSIYELDYAAKAELAIQTALRTDNNRLIYEKGSRELPKEYRFEATPDREYGKFVRYGFLPIVYAFCWIFSVITATASAFSMVGGKKWRRGGCAYSLGAARILPL